MRGHELLDLMALIDPKYIDAADKEPTRRVSIWLKIGAIAACIALIVAAFLKLPPKEAPQVNPTLPTTNHSENHSGYGCEGYSAYDISQVTNANPWYDTSALKALPVYDNVLSSNGAGEAWGADIGEMESFALEVSSRLGVESPTLEYRNYNDKPVSRDSTGPVRILVVSDTVEIEVDQMMHGMITFEPAISLPNGYNPSYNMSYEDAYDIAKYLKTEFRDLIDMDDPQIAIKGDYFFSGEPHYEIFFHNGSDNLTEEIINYNLRSIKFWCNEEGISGVTIKQTDLTHKVADYPIITANDALKALINGTYATSCGYEFPGKKYIHKVELIYRNTVFDDFFMPYYRFYVEDVETVLGEDTDPDLKLFLTYYVPAIDSAYIGNMPTYDGRFN